MPARDPFVLLDDARQGNARLYRDPVRIVSAATRAEVLPALAAIRAAQAEGLHAAGFLAYEAAPAFEPALADPPAIDLPLLWFGLFERFEEVDPAALLPDPAGAWIGAPHPAITRAEYDARLARVFDLIVAGDIYQANLTYRATVAWQGDPRAAYAQLRGRAQAGLGALVHTGADWLLSLSPELFFALEGGALTARPMKGTARRGSIPSEDAARAAGLAADPKQRAENLMIVDLMRNDLARVAVPGSVAVPSLFEIESYPTVHQMVSTITAALEPERDAVDVLAALFPCGSITGAPKVRAMEVIAEVEQGPRGVYTGAIGRIDAGGDAKFNVAIRTLHLRDGDPEARFGAGGGIVADSNAAEEWDEARAKGGFVATPGPGFDLIETMGFDPREGLLMLERHLARMKVSAAMFGFAFDRHATRNELQAATFRLREPRRIRLLLARSGAVAIEVTPCPAVPEGPVAVALAPLPVAAADFRLGHKTTDRAFYDRARTDSGAFEVLFTDADGFLTEGSFTNIFVASGDTLVTPPLSRGLLPGVLRAALIAEGRAVEGDLRPEDLDEGFFLGNALRGLFPAVAKAARASL
ncbi:aminodeoxychorismate synthase component I [Sphingomonas immobilis]|uniref:Probable branched-chain-amino-acid aminotransferase n=1 Tax=Sphingomonas immobilis TaxID=3063997 RepID=A0ABT8ZVQ6_9SPHN|nr:aminodeoxychorismate synthase component I [Sphingomonas sp. CA1-15]MDO7841658.1 aminodeoxychorismate synthase component I [Sphingomonas sp. CA1-15]